MTNETLSNPETETEESPDHDHADQAETATEEPLLEERQASAKADLNRINAAEQRVAEAEDEWAFAKEEASRAKKRYDNAVAELRRLIVEIRTGQHALPFDEEQPGPPIDEGGQAGLMEALGLTSKQSEAFAEVEVYTVADLEQYMSIGFRWWDDVQGIGESLADSIENLLIDWRLEHPVPAPEEAEEPALEWDNPLEEEEPDHGDEEE